MSTRQPTTATQIAPSLRWTPTSGLLQRACACGQHTPGGGECAGCKKKRLQRSAAGAGPAAAPPIVHAVLGSGGQPLDAATRSFMEPRFGRDFGGVRVHTGAQAAESAQAVGALAYTVGGHIAFGAGQYAPHTGAGRRLLAHELAHTVQQGGGSPAVQRLAVGAADTPDERAAERAAEQVSAGAAIAVGPAPGGAQLQRACGPAAIGTPGGCTNVSGEIVGERFRFVVNCDDLQPGELSRLQMFAATVASGETIEVHGFASLDGNAAFNEQLSCARALKAQAAIQAVLTTTGIAATVQAFNHGATPGAAAEQRSVVITRSGTVPPPTPTLPPTPTPNPTPTPTPTPPTPSTSACTPAQISMITSHVRDARTWINAAEPKIAAFHAGTASPADATIVRGALTDNFHTTAPADVATIAANFTSLRTALGGALDLECVSSFWCNPTDLAYVRGAFAWIRRLGDVNLCPLWFSCSDYFTRVSTIVHEVAHQHPGATDNAYEWQTAYATLSAASAIDNADSYAVTARQIYHGGSRGPGTGGTC